MTKGLLIKTSIKISVSIVVAQSSSAVTTQRFTRDFCWLLTPHSAKRISGEKMEPQSSCTRGHCVGASCECFAPGSEGMFWKRPCCDSRTGEPTRQKPKNELKGEARWHLSCPAHTGGCHRTHLSVHSRSTKARSSHSSPLGDTDPGSSGSDWNLPPSEIQTWPSVNVYSRCFLY